jgi:hypothetical protein
MRSVQVDLEILEQKGYSKLFLRDSCLPLHEHKLVIIPHSVKVDESLIDLYKEYHYKVIQGSHYFEGGNLLFVHGKNAQMSIFHGAHSVGKYFHNIPKIADRISNSQGVIKDLSSVIKDALPSFSSNIACHELSLNQDLETAWRVIAHAPLKNGSRQISVQPSEKIQKYCQENYGKWGILHTKMGSREVCISNELKPYVSAYEYYYHLDCFIHWVPNGDIIILNKEMLSEQSQILLEKHKHPNARIIDLAYKDYIEKPVILNLLSVKDSAGNDILFSSKLPIEIRRSLSQYGYTLITPDSFYPESEDYFKELAETVWDAFEEYKNDVELLPDWDWTYSFGSVHCLTQEICDKNGYFLGKFQISDPTTVIRILNEKSGLYFTGYRDSEHYVDAVSEIRTPQEKEKAQEIIAKIQHGYLCEEEFTRKELLVLPKVNVFENDDPSPPPNRIKDYCR